MVSEAGQELGANGVRTSAAHVAIIMDGNSRWAARRGLDTAAGHREGVVALRRTFRAAAARGVRVLTVFAFSTENWRRQAHEVSMLLSLVETTLQSELPELQREGVRLRFIGDLSRLPVGLRGLIAAAERATAGARGLTLCVALNYGGRADLAAAARAAATDVAAGVIAPEEVTEERLMRYLSTAGLGSEPGLSGDPDLIIRTSGERRLSNFMLWQAAYSELCFLDVLWPDFAEVHLDAALQEFERRDRRFGQRA